MSSRIEFIHPKKLNNEVIQSWFTLKSPAIVQSKAKIKGLNLGYNTSDEEEIVRQNREELLEATGISSADFATAVQVHETHIQIVENGGNYEATDALVTQTKGLALAIQVADCAAVLFGDAKNSVIGAAHAGWRGAVGNIIPKTLMEMKKSGADGAEICVYISPCISQKQFEVGPEVAEQFPKEFVDYHSYDKPHVDLKGFIVNQLLESGIRNEHIEVDPGCTMSEEQFYSYRREKDQSGRMMGIIKLQEQ